jgi:hypothetical protein
LKRGIGIIYGASIGSTTGAWIMAGFGMKVKMSAYAMPMIVFGLIMTFALAQEQAEVSDAKKAFPGRFEIPGSEATIEISGYVKLDLIHDFDPIDSEDTFRPSEIPTDGREGENTRIHARQSRLNIDFRRPSKRGPISVFVEGDFFGSGNTTFRLRHAFGTIGPILAGQSWSTFMDEDAMPPTVDFEEPQSFALVRQAMLRYTRELSERNAFAVALEEPDAQIALPEGFAGKSEDPLPDLTARFRRKFGSGHLQLSAFVGRARLRLDDGGKQEETIWAGNVSGRLALSKRDQIRFQLIHGEGLGRYRGFIAASLDSAGNLDIIEATAVTLSYQHFWRDDLSSHVVYSRAGGDRADPAPDTIEAITYIALNMMWDLAEHVTLGAEWLYGMREDEDGSSGDAHRLQLAVKIGFF